MTRSDIDDFRAGIEPLAAAGKLGALLAQFPASFKAVPESRDYLSALLGALAGYPVAVELRHKSWSDDQAGTLDLLNGHGAAFVQIDEPKFRLSIRQNFLPNVKTFYYMRLHGRNAANWWHHAAAEDRYNYLYSADELHEFSDVAGAADALVKKSYAYTNNHFASKSVVNAVMLKAQLRTAHRRRVSRHAGRALPGDQGPGHRQERRVPVPVPSAAAVGSNHRFEGDRPDTSGAHRRA